MSSGAPAFLPARLNALSTFGPRTIRTSSAPHKLGLPHHAFMLRCPGTSLSSTAAHRTCVPTSSQPPLHMPHPAFNHRPCTATATINMHAHSHFLLPQSCQHLHQMFGACPPCFARPSARPTQHCMTPPQHHMPPHTARRARGTADPVVHSTPYAHPRALYACSACAGTCAARQQSPLPSATSARLRRPSRARSRAPAAPAHPPLPAQPWHACPRQRQCLQDCLYLHACKCLHACACVRMVAALSSSLGAERPQLVSHLLQLCAHRRARTGYNLFIFQAQTLRPSHFEKREKSIEHPNKSTSNVCTHMHIHMQHGVTQMRINTLRNTPM